jgi:hypothetical protein
VTVGVAIAPVKVTADDAARTVSDVVDTVKPPAANVCAPGLVNPLNEIVVAVAAVGNVAHVVYVTVTTCPEPVAASAEHVAPVRPVIVIAPVGTVIPEGNVIVSVLVVTSVVAGVNPTVQLVDAFAVVLLGVNDTAETTPALAKVAVPSRTKAIMMAAAVNLLMRLMGLKPDESSCPTTE